MKTIDFAKYTSFRILPGYINRTYVLAPFLKHNNYQARTDEQLMKKLDKFLEDFKDKMGDKSKN
ncbi:hypothetical protein [Taibaiella koreensis]|uniref:hypothetical protein n=1 Tax=Taibaiella koreensis TaxID=1268548 RepID=UPI0013C2D1FA|nr:hypothetical protein [Taibaiella koreensis]